MTLSRRSVLAGLASQAAAAGPRISAAVIAQPGVNVAPYLKELGSSPLLDRIALCDETGQLFQYTNRYLGSRASDLQTFRNTREMLRQVHPDLVVISMEAYRAPAEIEAALQADCHVLLEKPGCTNIEDFDRLVRTAETRNRLLMLALATRVHPGVRKARQIIQSGALGTCYGATMHWIGDQTRLKNPEYQKSWFSSRKRAGGGKLLFHGIHYLDLISHLTGNHIVKVNALCGNVGGQPIEVEDAAVVAMTFDTGWSGTLNAGYYLDRGFRNLVQLWCSGGWLRFDPFAPLEWQVYGKDGAGSVQSFSFQDEDLYRVMFASVVNTILGHEPAFVTGRESRAALAAVFASYRAAEDGIARSVTAGG